MPAVIRPAAADDAPIIARLKQEVWPDDTAESSEIASAIQRPDHASHIALIEGEAAGFIDGFSTTSAHGVKRWEVDLLAVIPRFRGQGIAAKLIEANTSAGKARGVEFCRALIRVGNIASERAFECAGYEMNGDVHALYVKEALSILDVEQPESAHLIPVCTFGYSGVWLEGIISKEGLLAARSQAAAKGGQIAGAVISRGDAVAIWTAQAAGFDYLADFRWWQIALAQPSALDAQS